MSSYYRSAYHPPTQTVRDALWADDYFGRREYGVLFDGDETAYTPEQVAIPRDKVFVALPDRLSRDQAEPLCELTCVQPCCGDCDCNTEVQEAWAVLRERLINEN